VPRKTTHGSRFGGEETPSEIRENFQKLGEIEGKRERCGKNIDSKEPLHCEKKEKSLKGVQKGNERDSKRERGGNLATHTRNRGGDGRGRKRKIIPHPCVLETP